jgi:hypothetical protein
MHTDTKQSQLDFTPLDSLGMKSPVDILQRSFLLLGTVAWITMLIYYHKAPYLFMILMVILFIALWIVARKIRRNNGLLYTQRVELAKSFAASNGLEYHDTLTDADDRPGTLFQLPRSRYKLITQAYRGRMAGKKFELFHYEYSAKGAEGADTFVTVMEVTLPRVLPNIVIDSLVEYPGMNKRSVLPIQFDQSQMIKLEGDFHKYFDVYAPDRYAVSALTILAPNAMEVLLSHGALCDIEIIENKLYFYWSGTMRKREDFEQVFTTAQEILKVFGNKLEKSDIYATKKHAKLHAQLAARGSRLRISHRERYAALAATALVLALLLLIQQGYTSGVLSTDTAAVLMLAMAGSIASYFAWRWASYRRRIQSFRVRRNF